MLLKQPIAVKSPPTFDLFFDCTCSTATLDQRTEGTWTLLKSIITDQLNMWSRKKHSIFLRGGILWDIRNHFASCGHKLHGFLEQFVWISCILIIVSVNYKVKQKLTIWIECSTDSIDDSISVTWKQKLIFIRWKSIKTSFEFEWVNLDESGDWQTIHFEKIHSLVYCVNKTVLRRSHWSESIQWNVNYFKYDHYWNF